MVYWPFDTEEEAKVAESAVFAAPPPDIRNGVEVCPQNTVRWDAPRETAYGKWGIAAHQDFETPESATVTDALNFT